MNSFEDILTSQYVILALGYLYGIFGGDWIIYRIIGRIWGIMEKDVPASVEQKVREIEFKRYPWQASLVGITERFLYIGSLQINQGEFIAVWLTLKTIAQSRHWTKAKAAPGRAIYNTFLIGNALSIIFSLAAYSGMQWALGAKWEKDYTLALGVPLVILGISIIQFWRLGREASSEAKSDNAN